MKLRRAMTAAGAAAVVAPFALLATPAAFAADGQSPSPSVSASASDSASAPASASASSSASASASASADANRYGAASSSASASVSASTSAQPGTSAEPTALPTPCTTADVDPGSQLTISVSGLPGKIVAGSGWHTFKLTAANHSDQSLGQVQWLALVDNDSMSDDEKTWLSTYALLEYFNPKTKAWESLADEVGDGLYFGETPLGARQTVDIQLRVDITAKAPAGDGYTVGLGGYVDQEKNCVHSAFDYYTFTVLKPGSSNDNPGKAKPGKGKDKPVGGKQPQGGAQEILPTGSLASTGSSSALPVIALVGGVAVVAGAGTVFMVRRRKSDSGGTGA